MANSPSPSPSPPSSDYGSPCLCCGNKKRRALTSPSSSPSSSPSPPSFDAGNKRSKHTFHSSPTSVTSSFSFPTRSDYAAAPSLSLPFAIRDKFLLASPFNSFSNASASSSASSRPTTASSSSPFSIGTLSSQSPPSPVNLFPAFGNRSSFGQWAWPAKNVEVKAVTLPPIAKKSEEEAVNSPQEKKSETDTVIEQTERKIEKAVLLPIKEEDEDATAARISSLNLEKEVEAVASPQKKKIAEAVILPLSENEQVEVTIDCSSKSSSPRRSLKVESAREEIRVGLKCKCGIVREIILL